jgi:hypothetical protein
MRDDDEPIERRATRGLFAGWWTAKKTAWSARLAVWGMWLALLAGYVLYVWLRVRRMLNAERDRDAERRDDHAGEGRAGFPSRAG